MTNRAVLPLLLGLFSLLLAACGSGISGSSSTGNAIAKSKTCIVSGCHADSTSSVTGNNIVAEWQKSIHYRSNVAGCADCHDDSHGNGNKCADCHGGAPPSASSASVQCGKCHGLNHPSDRMVASAPAHFQNFYNMTGSRTPWQTNRYLNYGSASYVSGQYVGKCNLCHNSHDPSTYLAYNETWARSGMASTAVKSRVGAPEFQTEFKNDLKLFGTDVPASKAFFYANPSFPGTTAQRITQALCAGNGNTVMVQKAGTTVTGDPVSADCATYASYMGSATFTPGCVRCHTTTGFVNFVKDGLFMDLKPFGAGDPTKEVTACNACHGDTAIGYGKIVREVPAVTIYFNFSSTYGAIANANFRAKKVQGIPTTYSNFGKSNNCVPCHSGRGSGPTIQKLATFVNFSNTSIPQSHFFPAANTLDRKGGFQFYSSQYYVDSSHTGVNMSGLSPKGPCIGCHMNTAGAAANSHLFTTVTFGADFPASVIANFPDTDVLPTKKSVATVTSTACTFCHGGIYDATALTVKKRGFASALQALNQALRKTGVVTGSSSSAAGYYTAIRNVAGYTNDQAFANTAGAVFNYRYYLLYDSGAYVHSPLYAKRLIYDSLNWLTNYSYYKNAGVTTVYGLINKLKTDGAFGAGDPDAVATNAITWLYGTPTPSNPANRP